MVWVWVLGKNALSSDSNHNIVPCMQSKYAFQLQTAQRTS